MFIQVYWRERAALPSLLLAEAVGAPFSSRVSFQLAGPHWVQVQQTENLFTFAGGKICLFKYALQAISRQKYISTHVNRTNCQLNFDVIPLDVVDYAQIQSQVVPVYPTKQVSLQLDVYLNPPWEKAGVASVHRPNVVWGVYLRAQTTGACRSVCAALHTR